MTTLSRNAARASLVAMAVIFVLFLTASTVRLLPWLLAPDVPWRVAGPFARALAGMAAELAALVGPPVGFAVAAAASVRRGEVRALACLGVGPLDFARRATPSGVALVLLVGAIGFAVPGQSEGPGNLVNGLIEQGRQSCEESRPAALTVPIADVTWLCFEDGSALLSGPVPGGEGRATFLARNLRTNGSLSEFTAEEMTLVARGPEVAPRILLRAQQARIGGLDPWGTAGLMSPAQRALLLGSMVALLLTTSLLVVFYTGTRNRAAAFFIGAVPAAAGLQLIRTLDEARAEPWVYLLAAVGAAAVAGGMGAVQRWAVPWIRVTIAQGR